MLESIGMALGSSLLNRQATKRANKQTRIATAKQMAFQREMSNTSYQRGMQDMRLAGLNPILAGKMGGATTPTGASYVAQKEDPVGSSLQGVQTASAKQQLINQAQLNELKQMDIDYLRRKNLSPMQLQYTPFNTVGSQSADSLQEVLQDLKAKTNKNRDFNKKNPYSRKFNNLAPYETPYTKNKAKNRTGSRGSGKYLPPKVKPRKR